jgi:hypothetical protein
MARNFSSEENLAGQNFVLQNFEQWRYNKPVKSKYAVRDLTDEWK